MITGCTALKFMNKLSKNLKVLKLDIYLNTSENKYYSKDKSILLIKVL